MVHPRPGHLACLFPMAIAAASAFAASAATTTRAAATSRATTTARAGLASRAAAPATQVSIADLTHPESVVFMLTRRLESLPPGETSEGIRKQADDYRARAHDLKRRVGNAWNGPEEFDRGRRVFVAGLAEAEDLFGQIRRSSRGPAGQQDAQRKAMLVRAQGKLLPAAKSWPDPLLRQFLVAAAQYQIGDFTEALTLFIRCTDEAPRVAALWQGQGLALTALDRHVEALGCYNKVLRLAPDSTEALRLVSEGMRNVPGTQTKRAEYLEAAELVSRHDRGRQTANSKGISWLLPGAGRRVADFGLPTPAYDRLAFKQAVGAPVADNALAVEAAAVEDALEVFVRVSEGRLVRATVNRWRRREGQEVPLALVSVDGYRFDPLHAASDADLSEGRKVAAYSLPLYEEMGSAIHSVEAQLVAGAGGQGLKPSKPLAAGEAAAPVVTAEGRLAGFLAGRTDAAVEGCGPDRFIPVKDLADMLTAAEREAKSSARRQEGQPAAVKVEGACFAVLSTFGERITK